MTDTQGPITAPLYSTRWYAHRLHDAIANGSEWPLPSTAGQALVLAETADQYPADCQRYALAALVTLAEGYRAVAGITWSWDPHSDTFSAPDTGDL